MTADAQSAPALSADVLSPAESPAALAGHMRSAAAALLGVLTGEQRARAALPFADDGARRWLEYRPEPRPGACLARLSIPARKAAHWLLATGLSDHAFAQALVITALEEVLDRRERGQHGEHGRHNGDYWVAVFGDPQADESWSWRFEGHHVSVTMTVAGDDVSPAPVFLGANPAAVTYAGRPVSRPLAPEEDLARELLDVIGPDGRAAAVVGAEPPFDIRSSTRPRAAAIEPAGLGSAGLGPSARAALGQLVALYLDRLPPVLAAREAARLAAGELTFAWEGPVTPGLGHYYRVQGDDLLIEYHSAGGNHSHAVLRRPRSDFGEDVLAAHLRQAHA
jgi:Protein of unknown function (DUF3500)